MVFHRSLSDSKSPQVSRTLLSILAILNNAVIWMVSTRPPTSKPSSPFSNPLVTVPNALIIMGIIVTRMFHSFFNLLLLLLLFPFYFHFLTILHRIFTQDLARGKVCIYAFSCLFWVIIFWNILLSKGNEQFRKVQFFCISYRLALPGILLIYLSVPSLIIPKAHTNFMVPHFLHFYFHIFTFT